MSTFDWHVHFSLTDASALHPSSIDAAAAVSIDAVPLAICDRRQYQPVCDRLNRCGDTTGSAYKSLL